MTRRFDEETIRTYDEVLVKLDELQTVAQKLVAQARTLADCEPFQSEGMDESSRPDNAVLKILSKLRRDINDRIHRAREAIQTDLHSTHGQGRMPCWATEYGD